MIARLFFDPLIPMPVLIAACMVVAAGLALGLWRGLPGAWLRASAGIVILLALAGPGLRQEERAALDDIALLLVDQSASQRLGTRSAMTEQAAQALSDRLRARPNLQVVRRTIRDAPGDGGTQVMTALSEMLAEHPSARIAGIFVLSDGQVHDVSRAPKTLPAPLHLLLSGQEADWDRRLSVTNAPAFGILGEPVTLTLKVEEMGAVPQTQSFVSLDISLDGEAPQRFEVPIGREIDLPLVLPHAGRNVIHFSVPVGPGELTDRNNAALVQMNGVRERLRVLLVSGEPHPGGRTWRNLLKSDSAVDLVHFTILRPPEKQDGVPVSELSLIAFPTRELFLDKINDFDLIIFDRYKRRGILPQIYLENIANYVSQGGAVLVAAGPDFASADSLYRSPLGQVLPARPTARVIERGFAPQVSELGARHPVTAGLPDQGSWGRWMRQIELAEPQGDVVMQGAYDAPLLILDRVGEGRVALLASDHAWLWSRGFEGGGPQLELLKRLAHWMMGEPELEEDALLAEASDTGLQITRRTMGDQAGPVTVIAPDGTQSEVALKQTAPGRFEGRLKSADMGLYRLQDGAIETVIGLGPAAPREFEQTMATPEHLQPLIELNRGGQWGLDEGIPNIRAVRAGRPAAGRGWLGITSRGAYETLSLRQMPLLPPWLVLLLASGLILAAWLREGRR